MYNSLILSHINYGILTWGYNCERIAKLQKKAVRIISLSKYNAHTEPIFKKLNILKISDIFTLHQLKFYHKHMNNKLPEYFDSFELFPNHDVHMHDTRQQADIHITRANHDFAKKCIRNSLPKEINSASELIRNKVQTHSIKGFALYIKNIYLKNYEEVCSIINCFICQRNNE